MISLFKPSDPASQEIDSFMDGAKALFDSMIAEGKTSERNVGWFRIDIDKFPEMAAKPGEACQIIMGRHA